MFALSLADAFRRGEKELMKDAVKAIRDEVVRRETELADMSGSAI